MAWNNHKENKSVLVLDSDPDRVKTLSQLFGKRGYSVYSANTGKDALKVAAERNVTAVLLALESTGLNLEALIKHLRADGSMESIPVIVILESFSADRVTSALKSGASDYLIWPIETDRLITRVEVNARLKEDEGEMAESLNRYKEHFGNSDTGLFFTSRDGELLECNETLLKMLGYEKKNELLHRKVAETIYFSPEEQKKFRAAIKKKGNVKDFRVTFRRKGGEPISILISGQVVKDDSGDIAGRRGKNVIIQEADPIPHHKGFLPGLMSRLSEKFHSLFSASELMEDQYEKIERLGVGTYGEIWKVRDILKEPPEFFVAKIPLDTNLNDKFDEEAHILKTLSGHAGVPEIREIIDVKNKRVLIQEYVEGKTLLKIIGRKFEKKEVESVVLQLTDVVAHAHNLTIIHRDIKPSNIMVKPDGAIKLLDFGAAKELKEEEISETVIGSRPYMSPEQIMGQSQRSSDVWALGVITYLLCTGMLPFYHHVEKILMDMILESPAPPPSSHNKDIDPKYEHIIMKCLEKNPDNRYPDAGALKNEFINTFPNFAKQILPLY